MCGRYASFLPPEFIARLFGTRNPLPNLRQTWNMAPTMGAPVVRRHPESGDRHLDALTWGLVPSFTKDLKAARKPINARAETLSASGLFRVALGRRRCLVPASAFYEWKTTPDGKVPHAIARADGELLAFAGLWESWRVPEGEGVLRICHHHHESQSADGDAAQPDAGDPGASRLAGLAGEVDSD